jgi:hypothetical protein
MSLFHKTMFFVNAFVSRYAYTMCIENVWVLNVYVNKLVHFYYMKL